MIFFAKTGDWQGILRKYHIFSDCFHSFHLDKVTPRQVVLLFCLILNISWCKWDYANCFVDKWCTTKADTSHDCYENYQEYLSNLWRVLAKVFSLVFAIAIAWSVVVTAAVTKQAMKPSRIHMFTSKTCETFKPDSTKLLRALGRIAHNRVAKILMNWISIRAKDEQ